MNRPLRSLAILLTGLIGFSTPAAFAANRGGASSVMIEVHEMWISPNADCSGLTKVLTVANPTSSNFITNPTLGTLSVPNGTYPCIAFKMSDQIDSIVSFNSDLGNCTVGQAIHNDIARGDQDPNWDERAEAPDGTVISTAVGPDLIYVYFSVSGNGVNTSCFRPGAPCPISSAWVVNGDKDATFVADFSNSFVDRESESATQEYCDSGPPDFKFR